MSTFESTAETFDEDVSGGRAVPDGRRRWMC